MFLIQILLPRFDNDGAAFPAAAYRDIARALTRRFGGVTAYARAPAEGSWESDDGETHHDDVIIVEVMAPALDENWWTAYRQQLQAQFRQKELGRPRPANHRALKPKPRGPSVESVHTSLPLPLWVFAMFQISP